MGVRNGHFTSDSAPVEQAGSSIENSNFEFSTGVGQWRKYNNNSGSVTNASLTLLSGGGGILLTADSPGIAGNAFSVDTNDNDEGGGNVFVSTFLNANGDRQIHISTTGSNTNQQVVDEINAVAGVYVVASTGSGGTTYVSPTPVRGNNFYLRGGFAAGPGASPRDGTAGTDTTTLLRRVSDYQGGFGIGQLTGQGSMEWNSNGTNWTQGKGISVPFTIGTGHGFFGYRPLKISFLAAKSGSGTVKPYVIDEDTGLITDLTARGGTYGVWGPQSGDYRHFVYEYIPRPYSKNFRLCFHNTAGSASNSDIILFDSFKIEQFEDFEVSCVALCGNNQSVPNATDTVATLLASDDPMGLISSNQVVIPVTGRYFVSALNAWSSNATGIRVTNIQRSTDGGATWTEVLLDRPGANTIDQTTVNPSKILNLNQADRLRVIFHQTSGGSLSLVNSANQSQNHLSIYKIGGSK